MTDFDALMANDDFMWRQAGDWFAYDCTTGETERVMIVCERCDRPVDTMRIDHFPDPAPCRAGVNFMWEVHRFRECSAREEP